MALRATKQSGNWNITTSWNQLSNTPVIGTGNDITSSTYNSFSTTFTAPSTSDMCLGVYVFRL